MGNVGKARGHRKLHVCRQGERKKAEATAKARREANERGVGEERAGHIGGRTKDRPYIG